MAGDMRAWGKFLLRSIDRARGNAMGVFPGLVRIWIGLTGSRIQVAMRAWRGGAVVVIVGACGIRQ